MVAEAEKEQIPLPAKPTRGLMMRLLRDARNTPGSTVVPFGRYKGFMYQEVPARYLDWAMKEVKANPNAHEDLVRLATWASLEMDRRASRHHLFLHGYGRYVCREAQVTLNEFRE